MRRLALQLSLLLLVSLPAATHAEDAPPDETVRIPVHAVVSAIVAGDTELGQGHVGERLAAVNSALARAEVELVLQSVRVVPEDWTSLCHGADSLLFRLLDQTTASGELVLGVAGGFADDETLGCAFQDAIGTTYAVAVVQDPPYMHPLLAPNDAVDRHHAEILYAHELGHLLGGLHHLAAPQGRVPGATGTIMYPTLQYNVPTFSGDFAHGRCVLQGNICRIHDFVRHPKTAEGTVQRHVLDWHE